MPNLKNGRPAPIFVGGSVLWETDYSQKPDPKSKQNQWKLIMLHMRPIMPEHCSCRSSEVGNWEVSLVLKSWMFYACVLFAPVGLDWGVMYGYVTSWSGDPFAGKLRPSQHLSKAMHLDGERHVSEGRRLWFLPPGSRCVVKRSARL
jgi:hypothetical protein